MSFDLRPSHSTTARMANWMIGTQIAANVATTVGVLGLALAYWQLRASRSAQREATAIGIWKDYLELALEHPSLSLPQPAIVLLERGSERYKKYEWFVSAMLFASEQVLALKGKDSGWQSTIKSQLAYHQLYLRTVDFEPSHYSSELQHLVDVVISATPKVPAPPPDLLRAPA